MEDLLNGSVSNLATWELGALMWAAFVSGSYTVRLIDRFLVFLKAAWPW